jgi:hypothetical protein
MQRHLHCWFRNYFCCSCWILNISRFLETDTHPPQTTIVVGQTVQIELYSDVKPVSLWNFAYTKFKYTIYNYYNQQLTRQEVLGRTTRLHSLIRHGRHWKWHVQKFFCCRVCIRYRGNVSTEPLPSNDNGIFTNPGLCLATIGKPIQTHADWWEACFNEAVEMGSGAVIYVPSFIKFRSGVQELIGVGGSRTHTHKPTLFFQNKESSL